jgi:hypothetical protein
VPSPLSPLEFPTSLMGKNCLKCELTDETAFQALKAANKIVAENKDLEKPPFVRARFTLSNNVALTVGLDNCALDSPSL